MWPLFRAVRRRTFLPLFMSLFLMTDRLQLCFQMFVQNYGKSYSVIESVLTAWGRLDVQNPPASPALSLSYCCSVSQSLPPHGLQHARTPCPPPSPGVCSRSCQWRYLTVSSSVSPSPPAFSLSQHQSFPRSQLFESGGQSVGASASMSVFPLNIQCLLPLGLTGLTSLQSRGSSRVFSNTAIWKYQISKHIT